MDDPMQCFVNILHGIQTNGSAHCLKTVNWADVDTNLHILYTKGMGGVAGELLCQKLILNFAVTTLSSFHSLISLDPSRALHLLTQGFLEYLSILRRCVTKLHSPEVILTFSSALRCAVLQPDVMTGEHPAGREALFTFLRSHFSDTLRILETWNGIFTQDEVLHSLHSLTLSSSKEIRTLWVSVIRHSICDRVVSSTNDFTQHMLSPLVQWKEKVIDSFVHNVLPVDDKNARSEIDHWCQHFEHELLFCFGRKWIDQFFDLVIFFPDSTPILEDLQWCFNHTPGDTLRLELVAKAKETLACKLHHAGARTEDIVTVLISTIRSFCILFSKSEQSSSVFAVVSDTLQHLKQRKDSVSCIVRGITHPDGDSLLRDELKVFASRSDQSDDEDIGGWKFQRPDVLRVLLSALSVPAIVQEYRLVLAQDLLQLKGYDCSSHEEILERMKCIFGEDVLSSCIVMLRDIQQSRRVNTRIIESDPSLTMSAFAISATCWPPFRTEEKYTLHPCLQEQMEKYSAQFKRLKPNQALKWIPSEGTVTLAVGQENEFGRVERSMVELPLLAASIVLYIQDKGGEISLQELSKLMQLSLSALSKVIDAHSTLFHLVNNQRVAIQKKIARACEYTFEPSVVEDKPNGYSQEQIDLLSNCITSMLKAGGVRSVTQIENSLRLFGCFEGTTADLRKLLQYLVSQNKVATNDNLSFKSI